MHDISISKATPIRAWILSTGLQPSMLLMLLLPATVLVGAHPPLFYAMSRYSSRNSTGKRTFPKGSLNAAILFWKVRVLRYGFESCCAN